MEKYHCFASLWRSRQTNFYDFFGNLDFLHTMRRCHKQNWTSWSALFEHSNSKICLQLWHLVSFFLCLFRRFETRQQQEILAIGKTIQIFREATLQDVRLVLVKIQPVWPDDGIIIIRPNLFCSKAAQKVATGACIKKVTFSK